MPSMVSGVTQTTENRSFDPIPLALEVRTSEVGTEAVANLVVPEPPEIPPRFARSG